jgi:hypothetical protein
MLHFLLELRQQVADSSSRLYQQLDLTMLAAAGHSRGGKIAAMHLAGLWLGWLVGGSRHTSIDLKTPNPAVGSAHCTAALICACVHRHHTKREGSLPGGPH